MRSAGERTEVVVSGAYDVPNGACLVEFCFEAQNSFAFFDIKLLIFEVK